MTLPAWVPPDELKPAPAPLLLVQSFVNTRDFDLGTDLLTDAGPATGWLRESGLLGPAATAGPADLSAAREVREGIRALLARNSPGSASAASDLRPLQALAHASQPRLTVSPAGEVQLNPGPGGRRRRGWPAS